jgi:hypothetical protein
MVVVDATVTVDGPIPVLVEKTMDLAALDVAVVAALPLDLNKLIVLLLMT